MIKPTIGRVVLFHPNKKSELVFPAFVCEVHNDALINVGGFDNNGNAFGATSVPLLQDGDEAPDFGAYAEWMPYQKGQAAKTEELEKQMKEFTAPPDDEMKPGPGVISPAEVDELMAGSTVVKPGDEEIQA